VFALMEVAQYETIDLGPLLSQCENRCIPAPADDAALHETELAIRKAILTQGWFMARVEGTANLAEAVEGAYSAASSFHQLSEVDKELCHHSTSSFKHGGYFRRGEEPSYEPAATPSHVEDFCVSYHLALSDRTSTQQMWPRKPRGFKSQIETFLRSASPIVDALHLAFKRAFGLRDYQTHDTSSILRILRYPDSEFGNIAPHSDFEVFTILHQTTKGLQFEIDGKWLWAPVPSKDTFIVIPDDLLAFWTNGLVKPMRHQVVPCGAERYSLILFLAANNDEEAHPLPKYLETSSREPCRQFLDALQAAGTERLTQLIHLNTRVAQAEMNMQKSSDVR